MKRQIIIVLSLIGFAASLCAQQQIVVKCPECGHNITITLSVDGGAPQAIHDSTTTAPVGTPTQCKATTAKGTRCSRMAQAGSEYCWQHASKATTTGRPQTGTKPTTSTTSGGRCKAITKAGKQCSRAARSNGYCFQHGG